jgi:hypothetical protein
MVFMKLFLRGSERFVCVFVESIYLLDWRANYSLVKNGGGIYDH